MNTTNPLISVVVPFYNRENTIRRTILSVINQTFENWELIIVDDGSDNIELLGEIIQEFDDNRIILVSEEINRGGGHARNVGINRAKGEFIALLDSDDTWNTNKLAEHVAHHKNKSENLVSYSKSIIHYIDEEEPQEALPIKAIKKGERIADYLFVQGGFMPTPSLFGFRSVFLQCPFDTTLRRHQDYDFLLSLEQEGCEFDMINEVLVHIHWEEIGTKAGDRFYCPDISAKFLSDRLNLFSDQAAAAFRLNNVFAPLRVNEGLRKSLYKGFWSDLIRVKLWRVRIVSLSLFIFNSTAPLRFGLRTYKFVFRSDNV